MNPRRWIWIAAGVCLSLLLLFGVFSLIKSHPGTPSMLAADAPPQAANRSESQAAAGAIPVPAALGAPPIPPPFPIAPPNASKITVGNPALDGIATVTGDAGAIEPSAYVALINLDAHTLITTTAGSDGSFSANLFAPPGSSLLVKYEPAGGDRIPRYWQAAQQGVADATVENLNPLPGAVIYVGAPPPGDGTVQDFALAGALWSDEPKGWAGWRLTGAIQVPPGGSPPGLEIQPGELFTVTALLQATSPALNCTGTPTYTVSASAHLRYLFNADSRSHPWDIWFNAYLFTPTGLPIEHEAGGTTRGIGGSTFSNVRCASSHTLEADLTATFVIPADLPDGIYRPRMILASNIPLSPNEPQVVVWYHVDPTAKLPPLRVGSPAAPRIPWTLFGDYPVNGHRGVQAREDLGIFAMPTRVIYPPHQVVLPRRDERSGTPLVYQLEPGSPWLSATDRRLPPPLHIPLALPSGEITIEVLKPDGTVDQLGPAPILQSSVRTPSVPGGTDIAEGTGQIGDLFHLTTMDDSFAYTFEQYGDHTIFMFGQVEDIYGNVYNLESTYDVTVARVLDLDPAQLPTTPYVVGDALAPGLHVFPPAPADVLIEVTYMPFSDPSQLITYTISGQANRFGYFQPPAGDPDFVFNEPGEFRVDYSATYLAPDGTLWAGYMTWGNVIEGTAPLMEAHGRRGMDYKSDTINDMPAWFLNKNLPPDKFGTENYYPYFSGDIHWGDETPDRPWKGDSIHSILTVKDLTGGSETIYNTLRDHFPRARNCFRWPPEGCDAVGLEKRIAIGEAPLFITTQSGIDPAVDPADIDLWGYWYGSSERPDVHVREILSEDGMGTAYWRFNDTYGYQIGEPADGDQPGDIKWEFGGVVLRTITTTNPLNEYTIYSSLWVLLPHNDPDGARVTPPFRGAGALDGGPIMTLLDQDIDMLFLPKGVRPGDILELGDTFAFSGHVGPPLDSRVSITVTAPSQNVITATWHANKIGWLYDPTFDFPVNEPGRWTVEVSVLHDRVYEPTGINPNEVPPFNQHNAGTVLGTQVYNNTYEFYVVPPDAPRLPITSPQPGFIIWPNAQVEPIQIQGLAPPGTTAVHYTIHDKGVVMGQGTIIPDPSGTFTFIYDAEALHQDFPMLSLTAHEGRWEGLADEVSIHFLALTPAGPRAASVTLIGEEVFVNDTGGSYPLYLPLLVR